MVEDLSLECLDLLYLGGKQLVHSSLELKSSCRYEGPETFEEIVEFASLLLEGSLHEPD